MKLILPPTAPFLEVHLTPKFLEDCPIPVILEGQCNSVGSIFMDLTPILSSYTVVVIRVRNIVVIIAEMLS